MGEAAEVPTAHSQPELEKRLAEGYHAGDSGSSGFNVTFQVSLLLLRGSFKGDFRVNCNDICICTHAGLDL